MNINVICLLFLFPCTSTDRLTKKTCVAPKIAQISPPEPSVTKKQLQPKDQVSDGVVMELCGIYNQPGIAVKVTI